jgi:hypothetical protein
MRFPGFVFLLAALLGTATTALARSSGQDEAAGEIHGQRVYLEGRPVDAILLPDGSVAYLLERPLAETRHDSNDRWVLIAHPVQGGVTMRIDPITGQRVAIGTDPDGTYHGFGWFVDMVPDAVESEEGTVWTPLYETHPPDEGYVERAAPSRALPNAAVQRWWADWDDWLENLRAGDLAPHSGIVSGCRGTAEATVVTLKGDGTFQFLYRDRDRITYEGPQASGPCDFLGQRVTVWTLPCDDGPCIRKIQANYGPTESPKPPGLQAVADTPVPHSGFITDCRPKDGTMIVTVKAHRTFQFLYRNRDRVVYEGVQAGSPCDLVGRNVVVWTIACDEDAPCISKVEDRAAP